MKYMLLFISNDGDDASADAGGDQTYASIDRWFGDLEAQGKLRGGEELQPARNATTLRWSGGQPLVTDGPFVESKETIAGFATVDAKDLDEAIAIAKRWPARASAIEIRPIIDHSH